MGDMGKLMYASAEVESKEAVVSGEFGMERMNAAHANERRRIGVEHHTSCSSGVRVEHRQDASECHEMCEAYGEREDWAEQSVAAMREEVVCAKASTVLLRGRLDTLLVDAAHERAALEVSESESSFIVDRAEVDRLEMCVQIHTNEAKDTTITSTSTIPTYYDFYHHYDYYHHHHYYYYYYYYYYYHYH